jgi:hypothetical protein
MDWQRCGVVGGKDTVVAALVVCVAVAAGLVLMMLGLILGW